LSQCKQGKITEEYKLLESLFDELWPICRSISGPGLEQSMKLFQRHMPLTIEKVASDTQVFDWTVPKEWHFKRARLIGPSGEVICDSNNNNLHVVNYSCSINKTVTLKELNEHLHSLPELPTAIPYVTSYYKNNWGFCISDETRQHLPEGNYKAEIDAQFIDGGIPFAHCLLPGESDREILLSSYLCHPSMANNELSGPLALLALYQRIKSWPKRRFSYRFLLNPETIGTLCFLYNHHKTLSKNLHAGAVLTCLGGPNKSLTYKSSRPANSIFDRVAKQCPLGHIKTELPIKPTPFTAMFGSDERQYGSPGFNFPMGQFNRTRYGEYEGYHNSLDTKSFMSMDSLITSINSIEQFLEYAEICGKPINLSPYGEPQLGKRGLYPSINSNGTKNKSSDTDEDSRANLHRILAILNMADGENDLFDMAEHSYCNVNNLRPLIENLEKNNLISFKY
jgi:aminopeptidase-like protein